MAQVLMQDEIDALLNGVASQQFPTTESTPTKGESAPDKHLAQTSAGANDAKPYDFSRIETTTRGRLPGLEVILDDFAAACKACSPPSWENRWMPAIRAWKS